ncbi:hypothetical protein Pmani_026721 [Petrolisthes manimaculis]|uniref:Uncharacterized protein n=1 Tax=Petrolisthes manimaculis TaxID=1843537 RepID=A0AAE1P5B4_9EUCA|nr:hypothetical protein Pmani_026721 [Petrolisthes manimaculis]
MMECLILTSSLYTNILLHLPHFSPGSPSILFTPHLPHSSPGSPFIFLTPHLPCSSLPHIPSSSHLTFLMTHLQSISSASHLSLTPPLPHPPCLTSPHPPASLTPPPPSHEEK